MLSPLCFKVQEAEEAVEKEKLIVDQLEFDREEAIRKREEAEQLESQKSELEQTIYNKHFNNQRRNSYRCNGTTPVAAAGGLIATTGPAATGVSLHLRLLRRLPSYLVLPSSLVLHI